MKKENFKVAMKVGRPAARQAAKDGKTYLASECPLAALHLQQGVEAAEHRTMETRHPIELMAMAYGLTKGASK